MNRAAATAGALAALAALTGCLERRIVVTTNPPGARVWLNDVDIGVTPTDAEFTYHGTFDVRIERDGYEPIHAGKKAYAPVWEWPGIDLAAELAPWTFRKNHNWHFDLEPTLEEVTEPDILEAGILSRATNLRQQLAED